MEGYRNELHYELREEQESCGKEQRRHSSVHFRRYGHDQKNSFSPIEGLMTKQRNETAQGVGLKHRGTRVLFVNCKQNPNTGFFKNSQCHLEGDFWGKT